MAGSTENHLFEKENHLNQIFIFGFHVNFQGFTKNLWQFSWFWGLVDICFQLAFNPINSPKDAAGTSSTGFSCLAAKRGVAISQVGECLYQKKGRN